MPARTSSSRVSFRRLPPTVWEQLEVVLQRFEDAWRAGGRPALEDFLPAAGTERLALLIEMVHADLYYRLHAGEDARVEDYLHRFPELREADGVVLELIVAEHRLRGERQRALPVDAYLARFPELAAQLSGHLRQGWPVGAETPEHGNDFAQPTPRIDLPTEIDGNPPQRASTVSTVDTGPCGPSDSLPNVPGHEVLGELGRGGMGVVYKTRDLRTGHLVALKMMQHQSGLPRFKEEFRALQEVAHPNLVTLYDVVSDGRAWFFTMELVRGNDFLTYVRIGATPGAEAVAQGKAAPQAEAGTSDIAAGLTPDHLLRLRATLRQLAEGLVALHAAGKVHRDVKPSNVLVADGGHVKLLDLGLVASLGPAGLHQSTEQHLVGTLAYMAPEQANGEPVSPASDWYSVGVMLYEALTGCLPFPGGYLEMAARKDRGEFAPPRDRTAGVPADLDALCIDLLRRSPAERPLGSEVLGRLPPAPGTASEPPPLAASPSSPLLGRERHLALLAEAYDAARAVGPVAVLIHGGSGVGKSALVDHFLAGLRRQGETVVLAGRCYEREAVPYKALDGVVDGLARYLRRPEAHADSLLPRDVGPLARVFPVLQTVPAVAQAPRGVAASPDPQEVRRRAFAGLRELLARLGDRCPLVLSLDDLQWGDVDSARLLAELVRPPDPPQLLLLACYRREDAGRSPFLRTFLAEQQTAGPALDRRDLPVDPLPREAATDLARALLGAGPSTVAETIARESEGNPFFLGELAQCCRSGESLAGTDLTLGGVLRGRVGRLPEAERRLLELVAVSGRPLRRAEASRAADLGADALAAVAHLRALRLLRGAAAEGQEEVETYHDRIRESVVAALPPEVLRDHHRRLAEALCASEDADPEALAIHFQGAGEADRAAAYYARAADGAAEALAFDRAASLYRQALDLSEVMGAERHALLVKRGDALANAGRGAEAAEVYLAAVEGAAAAASLELRRRAAEQFLRSGYIEEGTGVLRSVLASVGLRMPVTPRRALVSLLLRRALLRCRGLGFRERPADQVLEQQLTRIDILWSAVLGFTAIDPIRGADFQARHLLQALRAGEPYRVARALAMEAVHVSMAGCPTADRVEQLLAVADALAQRIGHPHAIGLVLLGQGVAAYFQARWQAAVRYLLQAEELFRDRCVGATWELTTAQRMALYSLAYTGATRSLAEQIPAQLQEAENRGDRYGILMLRSFALPVARMVADDVEGLKEEHDQLTGWFYKVGFRNSNKTYFLVSL